MPKRDVVTRSALISKRNNCLCEHSLSSIKYYDPTYQFDKFTLPKHYWTFLLCCLPQQYHFETQHQAEDDRHKLLWKWWTCLHKLLSRFPRRRKINLSCARFILPPHYRTFLLYCLPQRYRFGTQHQVKDDRNKLLWKWWTCIYIILCRFPAT